MCCNRFKHEIFGVKQKCKEFLAFSSPEMRVYSWAGAATKSAKIEQNKNKIEIDGIALSPVTINWLGQLRGFIPGIVLNWINQKLISSGLLSWTHSSIPRIEFLRLDWILCFIWVNTVCVCRWCPLISVNTSQVQASENKWCNVFSTCTCGMNVCSLSGDCTSDQYMCICSIHPPSMLTHTFLPSHFALGWGCAREISCLVWFPRHSNCKTSW